MAVRYAQRVAHPVWALLAFTAAAFLLSSIRAFLFRRASRYGSPHPGLTAFLTTGNRPRNLGYLLLAASLYLVITLLIRQPVSLLLLLEVWASALLPDLDTPQSRVGRLAPFLSRRLEARFGSRQAWHSLGAAALVALLATPLIPLAGWLAWVLVPLGFVAHLAVDLLYRPGIMLLWPLRQARRYSGPIAAAPGSSAERLVVAALGLLALVLGLASSRIKPPLIPVVVPSYEQTVNRYLAVRGQVLVFADVDGTWQASDLRIYGRFEILNVDGASFVMLDRYTGAVFTAGRGADDNLYVNGIALAPGNPEQIKPVELHLQHQQLAAALPIIYQMQQGPGLQHIFISGDIVLPAVQATPTLEPDYAQGHLRKIVQGPQDDRHFSLHYLTAAELIALSGVQVDTADLVIVATYSGGKAAATATPLPSPPPTSTLQAVP